ncbi:PEST proteolytic signal-containing nuclear protein-like [Schistocerca americana]|uniref:PEST proteolytic signal-containing nuclear protein-like n=1 Tax=Schistocerca americana TaxID=7009 RepID=UPI001F503535|nr:PEST proteolytic signal-containing nuclear protein-like [Schistocerca americana]XP_049949923.1 PEST proteolytic signal-containing nuclear protein-like isoform X1 [Schistocerca serialis cubense]
MNHSTMTKFILVLSVSPCSGSPQNGPESLPDQKEDEKDKSDDDSSKKKKFSMGFGKPSEKGNDETAKKGIQIKLGMNQKNLITTNTMKAKSQAVAAVFNDDEDDEPEEMPPEARMRMRNIGRETPTSAGPNSFGKTKQGFCDSKKIFEKTMKKAMDSSTDAAKNAE